MGASDLLRGLADLWVARCSFGGPSELLKILGVTLWLFIFAVHCPKFIVFPGLQRSGVLSLSISALSLQAAGYFLEPLTSTVEMAGVGAQAGRRPCSLRVQLPHELGDWEAACPSQMCESLTLSTCRCIPSLVT